MKSYSSYKYSTGYDKFANDYSQYGSIFRTENPYKMNTPQLTRKQLDTMSSAYADVNNAWKTHIAPPVDRSLFDRTIDTLMTANYMSAGFVDGLVKSTRGDEGAGILLPFQQAGQGFMAGLGGVLGDGNEKHEYTYSRVLETAGWKPESTFGKIVKGTIGFTGDVLLDPTTYMTFGISAALKGTGRVGKAAEALNSVVPKAARQEVYVRTQSLISKGVDPARAANHANRMVEKNASKYQNVTELTSEMAEYMIRFDAMRTGTRLTPAELTRSSTQFAKEFNKAIGMRNYNRDISIGVRNLPFVGNKLGNKMGKAGSTVKLVDGNMIRKWSDELGVAKVYSDVRFNIYGGKIGKMLSTSSPKVKWAQKDPIQLYKLVTAVEKLKGKDIDKLARKKEINDIAKAMKMEPYEMREVITFLEKKTNAHKVRAISRIGETEVAKFYKTMAQDMRPDEFKVYDTLEQQYKSIKDMESQMRALENGDTGARALREQMDQATDARNVVNAEFDTLVANYDTMYKKYRAELARVDTKRIKSTEEHDFIVKALDEEINRIVDQNADISKQLRGVRKDAQGTRPVNDKEIMANASKMEQDYMKRDRELAEKMRGLSKLDEEYVAKGLEPLSDVQKREMLDELKAERAEIARNVRILNASEPVKRVFDYNPHQPNLKHQASLRTRIEAFKTVPEGLKREKAHEITESISNYVFGRPGMFETITDEQIMADVFNLIERGHSPQYISTIPMIHNDKFLTPRASAMYKLIASQLGYKSFTKEYLTSLKKLEGKAYMNLPKSMSAGTLTDVEKGRYEFLSNMRKRKEGLPKKHEAEYKKLVKKMQLQRDYEGVNPANYNFARLEPEEMQEYLHLKAVDEERTKLVEMYSRMSDAEFSTFAQATHTQQLRDDLSEMFHGSDSAWGGMDEVVDTTKTLINPEVFMDDAMREMRVIARSLNPKEQEEFFSRVVNQFHAEPLAQIPARPAGGMSDDALNVVDEVMYTGKSSDWDPSIGKDKLKDVKGNKKPDATQKLINSTKGTIKSSLKGADEVADTSPNMRSMNSKPVDGEKPVKKQISVMQAAYQELRKSHWGGRTYDELSAREQSMFVKSLLHATTGKYGKNTLDAALAKHAKKQADINAGTTRLQSLREQVWEGTVVKVGTEDGVVMVRRDLEDGTEFDVLMRGGKTYSVSADEITSISRHKRYDPKSAAMSKMVRESLGRKKELVEQLKKIDARVEELVYPTAKRAEDLPVSTYRSQMDAIEKKRAQLYEEHIGKLETFTTTRVPTQKGQKAESKMQKLETTRAANRKELAKLRATQKKEITKVTQINAQASEELIKIKSDFNPYGHIAERTRMDGILRTIDERIAQYPRQIEEYTEQMNTFQNAINDLGGASKVAEFEEMARKLDAYQKSFDELDTLEDFMRVQLGKSDEEFAKWAQRHIDEDSGLNALLRTIDDSPLSMKQKEWAKLVRAEFFRAGAKEVQIGKLKPEQFEAMASSYVYHDASPEFLKHKLDLERAMGHTSPTQDYGYNIKWSPSSKARTQDLDIHAFNETMRDKLKGKNAFNEDLAEIYVARMLKHEELMYDNKVMNTFAERFGASYKYGDEVLEGHNVYANFGKVREMFVEQARQAMKEQMKLLARENNGPVHMGEAEVRAIWEQKLADILPRYGFNDMGIMEGKTLPMLELTDDQIRLLSDTGLVYQMNTAIGDAANNARKIKMAKDENQLLQVYDKFLHFIKLHQTAMMPAFHIKNKYSNTFQNWLGVGRDAFDPKMQVQTAKVILARGDTEKLKYMKPLVSDDGTQVYHWDDIYEKAVNWGVIDEGFFAQDLSNMTASSGLFKNMINSKYDPTSTRDFVAYKFATDVGGHVEGSDRLLHFASLLKQGKSVDDAAESSIKYLFDYSDLTPFERTVMKRIFPYYTWIRKNSRLQVGELIEQPEKFHMMAKIHNGIEGMSNEEDRIDKATLPDFAKDWIQTPFTTTNGNGQKIPLMLSPNMPYMDLARLPDIFNPVDSAREWAGMTSPIMKVPIELATNYNTFFNQNIVKSDEENPDDNTKSPALARLHHVAKQLGWYSAGSNIVNNSGSTQGLHVLNTLGGIKLMNHNEIYARQQLMKGLYEGNSDLGRALTGFTEEIRTRINNKVYLMQGAALNSMQEAAVSLVGLPPTHAEDYTGALAPISRTTYDSLSKEERAKYAPPSKSDAAIYAKEALRLSEEAYAETGIMKKFVWSLFDDTDQIADKQFVRVETVADGDTFRVNDGNDTYNVRLLMVDTPETVDPDMDGPMPFGQEASDFTKSMVLGRDVSVQMHGRDAYGRMLAYVEVDGNDFNKMLIEEGLGKMRYLDGTTDAPRYNAYRDAEEQAAKDKRGLWSVPGYARPGKDEDFGGW